MKADTLKILQVETFYGAYLDRFYGENPALASASYRDQIDALMRSGFSALHNIAPYLDAIGYEPHFVVANCGPTQLAWLREHGLPTPPPAEAFHAIVRQQIEILQPDVLYFSDATSLDSRFVRTLARRPPLIMGWHAAPIPQGTDWSEFDVLLSGISNMRIIARLLGARSAELYMPGFPEWIGDAVGNGPKYHDVVFAGSYTPVQHARRNELLTRLADADAAGEFDCAFHINTPAEGLPPVLARCQYEQVFGVEMHRALTAGRICFDSRSSMAAAGPDGTIYDVAGSETANMRLFEATGSGVFLLTEHHDNLSRYFAIGEEIETFANEGELLEKVRYYLAHPTRREEIAARGRERCLRDHTMSRRIDHFDALVRRYMPVS